MLYTAVTDNIFWSHEIQNFKGSAKYINWNFLILINLYTFIPHTSTWAMDHTMRRKIPSIYRWSKGSTERHKSKKKCSYNVVRKKMAFPFPKDKLVTCTPGSGEAGYICILDFAHTKQMLWRSECLREK